VFPRAVLFLGVRDWVSELLRAAVVVVKLEKVVTHLKPGDRFTRRRVLWFQLRGRLVKSRADGRQSNGFISLGIDGEFEAGALKILHHHPIARGEAARDGKPVYPFGVWRVVVKTQKVSLHKMPGLVEIRAMRRVLGIARGEC